MLEGLFGPIHLLLLLFTAAIVFGVPLIIVYLLVRMYDKKTSKLRDPNPSGRPPQNPQNG